MLYFSLFHLMNRRNICSENSFIVDGPQKWICLPIGKMKRKNEKKLKIVCILKTINILLVLLSCFFFLFFGLHKVVFAYFSIIFRVGWYVEQFYLFSFFCFVCFFCRNAASDFTFISSAQNGKQFRLLLSVSN